MARKKLENEREMEMVNEKERYSSLRCYPAAPLKSLRHVKERQGRKRTKEMERKTK